MYDDAVDNADALEGVHRLTTFRVTQTATTLDLGWRHAGPFNPQLAGCKVSTCNDDHRLLSVLGRPYETGTLLPL